jgi:TRAP transporter TAXI family solute receptor
MALSRPRFKRPKFERAAWREWLIIIAPVALLVIAAFAFTSRFIQPAPPSTIVITTGGEAGAYYKFALRYREILKRDGITLEVKTSAGSLQNLERLRGATPEASSALVQGGAAPEASVAFVQGGTTAPEDSNNMLSLGRMFYEPVWMFHRLPAEISQFTQLRGKRVAIGPSGSGTRHLVTQLLGASQVTADNATFIESPGRAAADALLAGKVDAAFLVAAPDAALVQELLRAPGVKLMNFTHAEAYARRFPWLARVVLHRGVVDFAADLPAKDIELIAAVALLAVRDDVHPALQFALTQAAAEVHRAPGIFNAEGQFPQSQGTELPMSAPAERFHKTGPPFLQRYLPFWIAVLADRLLVLLIPILTILLPLIKILPFIYGWRVRRRIWHWYDELKKLEQAMSEAPDDSEKHQAEIERIDEAVWSIPVPIEYSEQYYNLRSHVEYVRRRLHG